MTLLIVMLYISIGVGLTAIVFPNLEYLPKDYQKVLLFFIAALLLPPFFAWHTANYYWDKLWA